MTFTPDSRWLAISTKRGTTHLYAINPYGGVVNVRTHTKHYVVNKTSRYQRTVGLDDQSNRQMSLNGNENPSTNNSPNLIQHQTTNNYSNSTRTKRSNHECLFATAVTSIRQPTENLVSGLTAPFNIDALCLATNFGVSRGFLNPEDIVNYQEQTPRACSSLYLISWYGKLIEYVLEPIPG